MKNRHIYEAIQVEREKQNEKWGEQNHDSVPTIEPNRYLCLTLSLPSEGYIKTLVDKEHKDGTSNWASIALEEFLEVVNAPNDYERRSEIIQLIAVLVQQVECIDRNNRAIPPALPEPFTDKTPMPFGKHKGTLLANVPADYLLWLYADGLPAGLLRDYIKDNLEQLQKELIK